MFTESANGFASKELSSGIGDICESIHQDFLLEKAIGWWGLRVAGVRNLPAVDVTSTDPDQGVSGPQRIILALGFRGQILELLNLHHQRWLAPAEWLT